MNHVSTNPPASAPNPIATSETYRAFLVAKNGRILGMVPLVAACEAEARTLARALATDEIVELWADLRLMARFETGGSRTS